MQLNVEWHLSKVLEPRQVTHPSRPWNRKSDATSTNRDTTTKNVGANTQVVVISGIKSWIWGHLSEIRKKSCLLVLGWVGDPSGRPVEVHTLIEVEMNNLRETTFFWLVLKWVTPPLKVVSRLKYRIWGQPPTYKKKNLWPVFERVTSSRSHIQC